MTFFEFFKKMPKMILEVLTLRLFWGLKSLNFKTFKTLVFDLVLKVLTLRLFFLIVDHKECTLQFFYHKIWLDPKPLSIEKNR